MRGYVQNPQEQGNPLWRGSRPHSRPGLSHVGKGSRASRDEMTGPGATVFAKSSERHAAAVWTEVASWLRVNAPLSSGRGRVIWVQPQF